MEAGEEDVEGVQAYCECVDGDELGGEFFEEAEGSLEGELAVFHGAFLFARYRHGEEVAFACR